MLIIDIDQPVFYEGSGAGTGIPIWPSPFLTIATIIKSEDDLKAIPNETPVGHVPLLFREDHFDAVTRVRRGRLYNRGDGAQPQTCNVQCHPALSTDTRMIGQGGIIRKSLYRFHDFAARIHLRPTARPVTIALGIRDAMTLWRVIGVEQISTGEDLVTLKLHGNMGVLPELQVSAIPIGSVTRVRETMETLVDAAYRGGVSSVVDRCRDLAASALGAHFEMLKPNAPHLDLGALIKIAKEEKRYLINSAANIIALLHSRGKPNEQERRCTPALLPDDAELALQCVSVILRDLGWVN